MKGTIEYKGVGTYEAYVEDTDGCIRVQLIGEMKGVSVGERLILQVYMSRLYVGVYDEGNVKQKTSVGRELDWGMLSRLASLLRYTMCNLSNKNKVYGAASVYAHKFLETTDVEGWQIPEVGYVECDRGVCCKMELNTSYFKISLSGEELIPPYWHLDRVSENVLGRVFRQHKDYLGFDVRFELPTEEPTGEMYETLEEIEADKPGVDYGYLRNKNYVVVTDLMLDGVIENLSGYKRLYYDTESTGLNINVRSRRGYDWGDQCVCVTLSGEKGEVYLFPLQMKRIENLCGGDHYYVMERYLRPLLEGKEIVAYNMTIDWKMAHIYDINPNVVDDVSLQVVVTKVYEDINFKYSLKHMTETYLDHKALELSDLVKDNVWGSSDVKFWDLSAELARLYACPDSDNLLELEEYIKREGWVRKAGAENVYLIELRFAYCVAYQEFYGLRLDAKNIKEVIRGLEEKIAAYTKELKEAVGYEVNVRSSMQMKELLYETLGAPIQLNKEGKVTTDAKAIKRLSQMRDEDGNLKYAVCEVIKKLRDSSNVLTKIESLGSGYGATKYEKNSYRTGQIFSQVWQNGTITGRTTSKSPNYQSYDATVKAYIKARYGNYAFDMDYAAVEYRITCSLSNNKKFIEAFKDSKYDYHRGQASNMYGVPYLSVSDEDRGKAKAFNFGIPYGMGDASLGEALKGTRSAENTSYAKQLKRKYYQGQECLISFFEGVRARALRRGYSESYYGRRRYYPKRVTSSEKAQVRRESGNHRIQATAADLYKLAMGRLFGVFANRGYLGDVFMNAYIHDELFGEAHHSVDVAVLLEILKSVCELQMQDTAEVTWTPFYIGFGIGDSWLRAKSDEWSVRMQDAYVRDYVEGGVTGYECRGIELAKVVRQKITEFTVGDTYVQLKEYRDSGKEWTDALHKDVVDLCSKLDTEWDYQGKSCQEVADTFCKLYGLERLEGVKERGIELARVQVDEAEEDKLSEEKMQELIEKVEEEEYLRESIQVLGYTYSRGICYIDVRLKDSLDKYVRWLGKGVSGVPLTWYNLETGLEEDSGYVLIDQVSFQAYMLGVGLGMYKEVI